MAVALDRVGVSHRGFARVLAGVASRAALTQEVPALIEGDLDLPQSFVLGVAEAARPVRLLKPMLFIDQLVDVAEHFLVAHGSTPRRR